MKKSFVFKLMFFLVVVVNVLQAQNNKFRKIIPSEYVNRVESAPNGVEYRIYLKEKMGGNYWKGIVLLADWNDEANPRKGSLEQAELKSLADALSREGYLAALVGYRQPEPIAPDWSNFNSNAEQLAQDLSQTADAIIAKYNQKMSAVATYQVPLSRSRVVIGGLSYSTYCLLTNVAYSNTLADMRGLLATLGSTGADQASKLKIPIYTLTCSNEHPSELFGWDLFDAIKKTNPNAKVKADSGYATDPKCSGHILGNWATTWQGILVSKVKIWLP